MFWLQHAKFFAILIDFAFLTTKKFKGLKYNDGNTNT